MFRNKLAIFGVFIVIAAIIAYSSLFTVHQTQQALVLRFGEPRRVETDPGLKFKLPWESVEIYERRILDLNPSPQEVLLADQKRINVDSFARYRIVDPLRFKQRAVTFANFEGIFNNRLNSAVRTEVARNSLADLLSDQRASIMTQIADTLKSQAPEFGVEVIDVRIGRTDLPEQTSQSVYNRMRSERNAQAAQLRAEGEELKAKIQAEADRDRTIILADANRSSQILRGEGEGQKTQILNEAYGRDAAFFDFYRSLEAYGALGDDKTTLVLSPDADFFRFFLNERGAQFDRSSGQGGTLGPLETRSLP
jgi:membrane protease subunit HflC